MKTEVVTVPLGDVWNIFHNHGLPETDTHTLLVFLVKLWLANEHDMHEDLTKDTIKLLELGELTEQLLYIEVLPLLLPMAALVHDSQEDGKTIAAISVKHHVISLEYYV